VSDAMVEKAVRAVITAYGEDADEMCPCSQDIRVARAVVDALLPSVDTLEVLQALPVDTKVLGATGEVWWRREFRWEGSGGGYSGENYIGRFLEHEGPLRVVWTPEVGR
jgi:hypothetical protein